MGAVRASSPRQWFYRGAAEGMTKDKEGRKGQRELPTQHISEGVRCSEGKLPYLCLYHVDATRP